MLSKFRDYFRVKRQSLVFRLLLYFLVSMLVLALILAINFTSQIKPHLKHDLLPNLAKYIEYVVDDIGLPPDLRKARDLTAELPFELRIEGPEIQWSSRSDVAAIKSYDLEPAPPPYHSYQVGSENHQFLIKLERAEFRYLFIAKRGFRSGSQERHWILFLLLTGSLFLLYYLIRRLFKPISLISKQVSRIGSGDLDNPVEVKGDNELAQLARGINDMSMQIKSMLEAKASLLLAISHELRSPITRMRVNLELVEDSVARQSLIDDCQEMEHLIANILESERLNSNFAPLNLSEIDVAEVIREVVEEFYSNANVIYELAPAQGLFDSVRIKLLIKNLLDNACRYTKQGTNVRLRMLNRSNQIVIEVVDQGPGIGVEDLQHITEPFYRADSARDRSTGGYGLGLYLCKLIVEAHHGSIEFFTSASAGTSVLVSFPKPPESR